MTIPGMIEPVGPPDPRSRLVNERKEALRCRDCLADLTGQRFPEYGQCHDCNRRELEGFMLDVLRRWWHEHPNPESRDKLAAWARWVKEHVGPRRQAP